MSALPVQDIFDALHDAGLSVSLALSGRLVVSPGSRLTPDLRDLIRGNKAVLVDWLELDPEPPTDPADWRELAAAYHAHHFTCQHCIAAGRGAGYGLRCGTGTVLWCAYAQADQPSGKNCVLTPNED